MIALVKVRIATFNCENLFARFKFRSNVDPDKAKVDGWMADGTKFDRFSGNERKLTAGVIRATKADVIALQEVENIQVLRKFRTKFLGGPKKYPYILVIDGNDPRQIDVGVISKYPLQNIDTHINALKKGKSVFSRDCLECDVVISKTKKVRLFVNHFKSMMDRKSKCKGRQATRKRRVEQISKVKQIINNKKNLKDFVILGDFNDYRENDIQGKSAIRSFVNWNKIHDPASAMTNDQRWTHYWKGKKSCGVVDMYTQLDYILLSKSLAKKNPNTLPEIVRIGMTTKAKKYSGTRLKGITSKTKASDHAAVVMELTV